jgi:hypothetical protein
MTEASTGTGSPSRAALPAGPVWRAGLLAAVGATVVNVVAWLALQPLLDVDLGRQLGLFLFHLLAAGTVIAVVRQQLPARPGQ